MFPLRACSFAEARPAGRFNDNTARAKTADVLALKKRAFKAPEIATQSGMGVASVYRILADHKAAQSA